MFFRFAVMPQGTLSTAARWREGGAAASIMSKKLAREDLGGRANVVYRLSVVTLEVVV